MNTSAPPITRQSKLYVAGHRGMVGSAIVRRLQSAGYGNIVTRTHAELDLLNQAQVDAFFRAEKPDYVFMAAAKVGGIHANNVYRADFIYQNLMIEANVVHAAWRAGTRPKKLLSEERTKAPGWHAKSDCARAPPELNITSARNCGNRQSLPPPTHKLRKGSSSLATRISTFAM